MARIIIAGSRDLPYDASMLLFREMHSVLCREQLDVEDIDYIISGAARGADKLGEKWAEMHGVRVYQMPAEWMKDGKYNKYAGIKRNGEMARFAAKDFYSILVALWDGESRGTKNMIEEAERNGLHVYIVKV